MKSKYILLFRLRKLESVSVCVYMQVHVCVCRGIGCTNVQDQVCVPIKQ